jgi:hypothetical protein
MPIAVMFSFLPSEHYRVIIAKSISANLKHSARINRNSFRLWNKGRGYGGSGIFLPANFVAVWAITAKFSPTGSLGPSSQNQNSSVVLP